jgi:hypothetical protein
MYEMLGTLVDERLAPPVMTRLVVLARAHSYRSKVR